MQIKISIKNIYFGFKGVILKFYSFNVVAALFFLFASMSGCHKDKKENINSVTYSSMTDRDGNVYQTVIYKGQEWMAGNLKVRTFNNGDPVKFIYIIDSAQWRTTSVAAYCLYGNDSALSGTIPLYNWYAVNDIRKLAPVGWHIPTDEDWKTLESNLGMSSTDVDKVSWRGTNEGNKLKIVSTSGFSYWVSNTNPYSIWGTNEIGFSAKTGSCRLFNGAFGEGNITAFWWSSSQYDNKHAWYRYLDHNKSNIFRFYADNRYGMSVRCVKDK